jgi:hypothetical protein
MYHLGIEVQEYFLTETLREQNESWAKGLTDRFLLDYPEDKVLRELESSSIEVNDGFIIHHS